MIPIILNFLQDSTQATLSGPAIGLLIFGIVVLYGGLARSLIVAWKHKKDVDLEE